MTVGNVNLTWCQRRHELAPHHLFSGFFGARRGAADQTGSAALPNSQAVSLQLFPRAAHKDQPAKCRHRSSQGFDEWTPETAEPHRAASRIWRAKTPD